MFEHSGHLCPAVIDGCFWLLEVPVGGTIFVRWSQPELQATVAVGASDSTLAGLSPARRTLHEGWRAITVRAAPL